MVNGFLVRTEINIDNIIYSDENFNPSRQALDLVFLPIIMDDIRIEIMGINSFITLVGIAKK